MPTSSIHDPNVYYSTISIYLYSILGSTLIIIGTIGSISSCIVFAQKAMRQNPASIYFIAYNIANLIRLWESLFLAIMTYHCIDPVTRNVPFCKIHFYIQFIFFMLTPYYLILSSIDRVLVTSSNQRTRERSTLRLAYRSIVAITLTFAVIFVQLFPFIDIYPIYSDVYICYMPPGNYRLFMSVSAFVLNGFLPSVLLGIFGMFTLKNLHRGHVQPVNAGAIISNARRKRERQLALMLLAEIVSYMPFNFAYHTLSLYRQTTQSQIKNRQQQAVELFCVTTFFIFTFIPSALSFYLYLAVSKAFRQKAKEVILKLCRHRPIHDDQR